MLRKSGGRATMCHSSYIYLYIYGIRLGLLALIDICAGESPDGPVPPGPSAGSVRVTVCALCRVAVGTGLWGVGGSRVALAALSGVCVLRRPTVRVREQGASAYIVKGRFGDFDISLRSQTSSDSTRHVP